MIDTPTSRIPELEALLFSYGEPMAVARIAKSLDLGKAECEKLIDRWAEVLAADPSRGLTLIRHNDAVQLVTKPELKAVVEKLLQEEFRAELSPATLETLSLITYLGPVPRSTIDYIRGVNSGFTVRNLLVRGLVERKYIEGKGNIFHYYPSFEFLKHMGLMKPETLPDYERFHTILERLEVETAAPEAGTASQAGTSPAAEPTSVSDGS